MVQIAKKRTQAKAKRICSECNATETYSNWRLDGKGGWLCKKCYMKNYMKGYNITLFNYKHKPVKTQIIPRVGVCNFCRAIVGEINVQIDKLCKRTSVAHMSYHDDNPLKDTIELCVSCHRKFDSANGLWSRLKKDI